MLDFLIHVIRKCVLAVFQVKGKLAAAWSKHTERPFDCLWARLPITNTLATGVRTPPRVGIAVLAHERPEYLELCLDSLFATNLHDYEVTFLIQDDGSTDPRVRQIIERPRDPKCRIIRSFTPKGHNSWGAAFNKAMRKLQELGEFDIVGSCDSDAYFHPEWLDKTLKVALWAKGHHRHHILGPFSCFNSSDFEFHRILGTFHSPHGDYVVKERMGALVYLYFTADLQSLGYFEESKDDETLMTEEFKKKRVRNFSTETSYVEHLGRVSVLDAWRPNAVADNAAFGVKLASNGWILPEAPTIFVPRHRLQNDLVIHVKYGGLGDHLFFSHLPRIAKETGSYRNVLISEASPFRNAEIRKLVWELNPYVDGFCAETCPCPDISQDLSKGCNLLDKLMLTYNLDDGERRHEPEVYYVPKFIDGIAGKTIYDPNYISNAGRLSSEKVSHFFVSNGIEVDYQMQLREKCFPIESRSFLLSQSLQEFCDMIFSCGNLYCLVTGTATLASALNKPATILYGDGVSKFFMHSKLHRYKKI